VLLCLDELDGLVHVVVAHGLVQFFVPGLLLVNLLLYRRDVFFDVGCADFFFNHSSLCGVDHALGGSHLHL
jgi:hypothetical protein